jgi:hypothetical protein
VNEEREYVQTVFTQSYKVTLVEEKRPTLGNVWHWELENERREVVRRGTVLHYSAGDAAYGASEALGIRDPGVVEGQRQFAKRAVGFYDDDGKPHWEMA